MGRSNLYKRDWGGFFRSMLNPKGIGIAGLVLLIIISSILEFTHEEEKTVKVLSINTQQCVAGEANGVTTYFIYLVSTDQGVFEITPDGIMASPNFGSLKEGDVYEIKTRGYYIPLIGKYPYIINAKKISKQEGES